jgi:hypothetical protein
MIVEEQGARRSPLKLSDDHRVACVRLENGHPAARPAQQIPDRLNCLPDASTLGRHGRDPDEPAEILDHLGKNPIDV